MDDKRYLRVPKDGSAGRALGITVDHDFEIAIRPVSVGQYEAFCAATGFRTTAECGRLKDTTYFDNSTLHKLTEEVRANAPAVDLSHRDAVAYCEWARCRLPTEAEWILAATVILEEAKPDMDLLAFYQRYELSEDILKQVDTEITATQPSPTTCVVRRGPYLVLSRGKTVSDPSFRRVVSIHEYLRFQFRVCKRREKGSG
jgi:formylglycine-generating enzyme required for sulfatase activity